MSSSHTLASIIQSECIRRINDEGILRIKKCLSLLTEDQVWFHPNENLTSVGNLCLHLMGNVNQWLNSTLGDLPDSRLRDAEFDTAAQCDINELVAKLDSLSDQVKLTVSNITEADLTKNHKVQCYEESGASIIIHVIEHFSYHVGQITYYTKLILDVDTGYYEDENLDETN